MFGRRRSHARSTGASKPLPDPVASPPREELPHPQGPWDAGDVDLDELAPDAGERVDLGSLVIAGRPRIELRLQVDEHSQAVTAVLLVAPDGAVELRAFAAPRNEAIWDDVRREIGAEATRRGGTATEQPGPYGTELRLAVPVRTPDGRHGTQVSRVVGVSAPRWLLRGTFVGRAATDPDPAGDLEQTFRDVVVRRGSGPMAPRSPLPLRLPPAAQPPGSHPPGVPSPGSAAPDGPAWPAPPR
ncbi:MAG: DUF3710 domain-containing protein [Actinomycetota bacterium]|nr:DUF3710 domain-containing protein [Actinomycetota bacterium]